jgi:hypothetical protein
MVSILLSVKWEQLNLAPQVVVKVKGEKECVTISSGLAKGTVIPP